jgi:hypothetical protein
VDHLIPDLTAVRGQVAREKLHADIRVGAQHATLDLIHQDRPERARGKGRERVKSSPHAASARELTVPGSRVMSWS